MSFCLSKRWLLLSRRLIGPQGPAPHQDMDSTSTCSSKEQWLIAAAVGPNHVRVVHDAGKSDYVHGLEFASVAGTACLGVM
jgi:hypothetical protein